MLSAVIYAFDAPRLASFYEGLVGGQPIADPEGRFFMLSPPTGGFEVHVVAMGEEYREVIEISVPPEPREETPIKLVLDVDDMEAAHTVVTAHGGRMSPAGEAWAWRGMLHRDGVDPEGNVFQLRSSE